jgi:hypothetical protein
MAKLTKAQRALLERLVSGPKLRSQIEGSGRSMAPRQCLASGLMALVGDEHVRNASGDQATSYAITEAGRAALAEER